MKFLTVPDGKIYIATVDSAFLGVIHNPNSLGTDANLENRAIEFRRKNIWRRLAQLYELVLTLRGTHFWNMTLVSCENFATLPHQNNLVQTINAIF